MTEQQIGELILQKQIEIVELKIARKSNGYLSATPVKTAEAELKALTSSRRTHARHTNPR